MYRMKNRKFRQIIAEKHCELCQLVIGKNHTFCQPVAKNIANFGSYLQRGNKITNFMNLSWKKIANFVKILLKIKIANIVY